MVFSFQPLIVQVIRFTYPILSSESMTGTATLETELFLIKSPTGRGDAVFLIILEISILIGF
jgi:hypothetical protein